MSEITLPVKKVNIISQALGSVMYYLTVREKRRAAGMFIALLVASFLDVFGLAALVPVIMAASQPGSVFRNSFANWLYTTLGFQSEQSFLLFLVVGLMVFFLFKNLFSVAVNYQQVKFTARLALTVISTQVDKYNNLPFWEYMRVGSASLSYGTTGIPQSYISGIVRQLFVFFTEIIVVAVIIIGILFYQPALFAILIVVLVPAAYLTYRLLRERSARIGHQIDEKRPITQRIVNESFAGFIELKLGHKQQQFRQELIQNEKEVQDLEATSNLYGQIPVKIIEMVAVLAIVTIFVYSLYFTKQPDALIGIVGTFAAAAYRLMPSVNRILVAMMSFKQFQFTYQSLEKFREYENKVLPRQKPLVFNKIINFDNITFRFPDTERPVLDTINIEVQKGEKIGLIGTSGSGKTTLMNLLLRFYTEQEGAIRVDGEPLTDENLQAWYRIVGYVKQDTFLMDTSVKNNITLNDENIDQARLHYAIEQASLQDFVASLPEGVETRIGERGGRLSGGQRQRIGIARALYKRTEILVMDEATSALDNETEREVNEAIAKLAHTDITIFIVAHRLTTLRDCNRIIELRDGKIYAEHQYAELISRTLNSAE